MPEPSEGLCFTQYREVSGLQDGPCGCAGLAFLLTSHGSEYTTFAVTGCALQALLVGPLSGLVTFLLLLWLRYLLTVEPLPHGSWRAGFLLSPDHFLYSGRPFCLVVLDG